MKYLLLFFTLFIVRGVKSQCYKISTAFTLYTEIDSANSIEQKIAFEVHIDSTSKKDYYVKNRVTSLDIKSYGQVRKDIKVNDLLIKDYKGHEWMDYNKEGCVEFCFYLEPSIGFNIEDFPYYEEEFLVKHNRLIINSLRTTDLVIVFCSEKYPEVRVVKDRLSRKSRIKEFHYSVEHCEHI
ncbi:hypothetical protein [Algivirga pacifica]|uniref:Uncharacterized protein n=1 Tax=Algivirga pacifica TaxID=1162670 RepID=A0ABP9D3N1_9BACT